MCDVDTSDGTTESTPNREGSELMITFFKTGVLEQLASPLLCLATITVGVMSRPDQDATCNRLDERVTK